MFVRGGVGTANGNTPDIGPWSGHVTQKTERLDMQMYTATLESHEQITTYQKMTLIGQGKESDTPPLRNQNAQNLEMPSWPCATIPLAKKKRNYIMINFLFLLKP